jgi:hypothetical protein
MLTPQQAVARALEARHARRVSVRTGGFAIDLVR